MGKHDPEASGALHVETIKQAFAAALNGDVAAVASLLAEDVHWYGAGGDPSGGCTNRQQALRWMGAAIGRGVSANVLDVQALDANRVLVRLQRQPQHDGEPAGPPHGQIVTFRGDQVSEIVVFPSDVEALAAAQRR